MNPFAWTIVSTRGSTDESKSTLPRTDENAAGEGRSNSDRDSKWTQTQKRTRAESATQTTAQSSKCDEIKGLVRVVSRLQSHVQSATEAFDAQMRLLNNRERKRGCAAERMEACVRKTADRLDELADQFAELAIKVANSTTPVVSSPPVPYTPGTLDAIQARSRQSRVRSRSLSRIYVGQAIQALYLNRQWKDAVVTRVSRNRHSGAVESVDAYFVHDTELTLSVSGRHLYTHLSVPQ